MPGRTRFDALKREWKRAPEAQRKKFFDWLRTTRTGLPPLPPRAPKPAIADSTGILTPPVVAFLKNWIEIYKTNPGRIMKVMGYPAYDTRLAQSLERREALPADIIGGLTLWLKSQAYPGV